MIISFRRCLPRTVFALIAGAIAMGGCERQSGSSAAGTKRGAADDPVVRFEDNDAEMNAAVAKAKSTVNTFIAALKATPSTADYFAVKKPFPNNEGGREHIWVGGIEYRDGAFHGTIDNVPADVPALKVGDQVVVTVDEISDWMIVDRGKMIGAYTMRVMRGRMTPEERAEFDAELGVELD